MLAGWWSCSSCFFYRLVCDRYGVVPISTNWSFLWVSVSLLLLLGESCRCLGSLVGSGVVRVDIVRFSLGYG